LKGFNVELSEELPAAEAGAMKGEDVGGAEVGGKVPPLPAAFSIFAKGFPASCNRSSLALSDAAGGAVVVAGASQDGAGAPPPAGAATPNKSRIFGVSSAWAAGAAANGLWVEAFSLNFSIAAASSSNSF